MGGRRYGAKMDSTAGLSIASVGLMLGITVVAAGAGTYAVVGLAEQTTAPEVPTDLGLLTDTAASTAEVIRAPLHSVYADLQFVGCSMLTVNGDPMDATTQIHPGDSIAWECDPTTGYTIIYRPSGQVVVKVDARIDTVVTCAEGAADVDSAAVAAEDAAKKADDAALAAADAATALQATLDAVAALDLAGAAQSALEAVDAADVAEAKAADAHTKAGKAQEKADKLIEDCGATSPEAAQALGYVADAEASAALADQHAADARASADAALAALPA